MFSMPGRSTGQSPPAPLINPLVPASAERCWVAFRSDNPHQPASGVLTWLHDCNRRVLAPKKAHPLHIGGTHTEQEHSYLVGFWQLQP